MARRSEEKKKKEYDNNSVTSYGSKRPCAVRLKEVHTKAEKPSWPSDMVGRRGCSKNLIVENVNSIPMGAMVLYRTPGPTWTAEATTPYFPLPRDASRMDQREYGVVCSFYSFSVPDKVNPPGADSRSDTGVQPSLNKG